MRTFTLQMLALLTCMLCGLLSTLTIVNAELEGSRLFIAGIASFGCLAVSLVVACEAYKEYKKLFHA